MLSAAGRWKFTLTREARRRILFGPSMLSVRCPTRCAGHCTTSSCWDGARRRKRPGRLERLPAGGRLRQLILNRAALVAQALSTAVPHKEGEAVSRATALVASGRRAVLELLSAPLQHPQSHQRRPHRRQGGGSPPHHHRRTTLRRRHRCRHKLRSLVPAEAGRGGKEHLTMKRGQRHAANPHVEMKIVPSAAGAAAAAADAAAAAGALTAAKKFRMHLQGLGLHHRMKMFPQQVSILQAGAAPSRRACRRPADHRPAADWRPCAAQCVMRGYARGGVQI